MTGVPKKATQKLLGEVREDELAIRLIGAYAGVTPPRGKATAQLLAELPDEVKVPALRQARAAILYMAECFANARRPQ